MVVRMIEERQRIIHDLESAIRVLELVRDHAQQTLSETASSRAFIGTCKTSILAAKARIEELERED
jgi:hypothetical protein